MSQIDFYKNSIIRKREEIVKLQNDLSKQRGKILPLQRKIIQAKDSIKKTKVQSTIKSKNREIDLSQKSIAEINKKCFELEKKIAKKENELVLLEKNLNREEEKNYKRSIIEEKKRQREQMEQMSLFEQTIQEQVEKQTAIREDIEKLKSIPKTITVLFLASNPIDTDRLRLDEEVRVIQERIRLSDYRDSICFESRWATRTSDILQHINETNPTIIHFSGHGTPDGELVLLNTEGKTKLVSKEAITMAISTASDSVRLVVFNACFSEGQAENIVHNIDAAVGMSDSILDDTAIVFAAQFYSAIGFGRSLQSAFDQAIAAIKLEDLPQENVPQLFVKDGVLSNEIIFVNPQM